MGVSDYVLRVLIADPYLVDVVFGLVSLLSVVFFFLALHLTLFFVTPLANFIRGRFFKDNARSLLIQLQARRNELYCELNQIEDELLELMPINLVRFVDISDKQDQVFDNKLADKSDQVFEGLHQV